MAKVGTFSIRRLYEVANGFGSGRYRDALGNRWSENLAAAAALAEALSEWGSPFELSARRLADYLYQDAGEFALAGGLIRQLQHAKFIEKVGDNVPEQHKAATYKIAADALAVLQ